jgi:hypothetical protein
MFPKLRLNFSEKRAEVLPRTNTVGQGPASSRGHLILDHIHLNYELT